jgi:hypothetical protein
MRKIIAMAAAAALLVPTATPAVANGRHHHHHDDGVNDVIGGAILAGGIAALASAITQGNRAKQDAAVEGCSTEAESRTGGRVAEIVHVGKSKGYYTVEGALEGADGGARRAFSCTIRNGSIYGFRAAGDET